MAEGTRPLYG